MLKYTCELIVLSLSTVVPQILDPPDNLTVVEPEDATFSCLATGRPRPAITWIRLSDFAILQPSPGNIITVEQEIGERERRSNLTIVDTGPSDADAYGCVAMNEPGDTTEQATLIVHGKPNKETYMTLCLHWQIHFAGIIFSSHTEHHLPCGQYLHVHCE